MKFYNKYYKSCYDELITYYPRFYKEVFEMDEILKVFGGLADELEDNIEQTYLNNFILTADLETIKTWESILEITYTESLTLDQRKSVVIARLMGYGHIGEPEIRGVIACYTENAAEVDFALGIIYIVIEGEVFDEDNLLDTLLRRIPAHLALDMRVHTERTFRNELLINFGGAIGTSFEAAFNGKNRASTMPLNRAGGMFYHTHIKSKLIE